MMCAARVQSSRLILQQGFGFPADLRIVHAESRQMPNLSTALGGGFS